LPENICGKFANFDSAPPEHDYRSNVNLHVGALTMASKPNIDPSFGSASSIKKTAERLDTSIPTIYKLIHENQLESFKIGKYRRILDRSIERLIARRLAEAKSAA
jgi:excisionase family DNA binding protein